MGQCIRTHFSSCGNRTSSGGTAARSARSAAFAPPWLAARTGPRSAPFTERGRGLLHLGGDLQFFADRLARVGLESVRARATALFRRSAELFGFAAEPLGGEEDLVAMPPRVLGSKTRLLGAQSRLLCKTPHFFRIDSIGLRLGPPLFRCGARDLRILPTIFVQFPLLLGRTDRRSPGRSFSLSWHAHTCDVRYRQRSVPMAIRRRE